MKKMFGVGLIVAGLIWGFVVLILYSDSFISDSKAEIYSAIIFVMIAVGLNPIIIKSKK